MIKFSQVLDGSWHREHFGKKKSEKIRNKSGVWLLVIHKCWFLVLTNIPLWCRILTLAKSEWRAYGEFSTLSLQLFCKAKITTKCKIKPKNHNNVKVSAMLFLPTQASTKVPSAERLSAGPGYPHGEESDLDSMISLSAPKPGDQRNDMCLSSLLSLSLWMRVRLCG